MKIIATDLDRTLMPNGNHRLSKGAMNDFKKELGRNKGIRLVYVTGRYKSLIVDGMKRYKTPKPDFIISLLGTIVYDFRKKDFTEDKEWQKKLEKDWRHYKRADVAKILDDIPEIWEQGKITLNDYKESYYFDIKKTDGEKIARKVGDRLKRMGIKAEIIHSIDVNRKIGLLDVVPKTGTKMAALNYLIKKLKVDKKDVLYCGDSGNDLLPMTSGVRGVLVKNASDKTKERLKNIVQRKKLKNKVHIAQGFKGFNGNYVSGIIEAAYKFGFFK